MSVVNRISLETQASFLATTSQYHSRSTFKTKVLIVVSVIAAVACFILFPSSGEEPLSGNLLTGFSKVVASAVVGSLWQNQVCANVSREEFISSLEEGFPTRSEQNISGISTETLFKRFERIDNIMESDRRVISRVKERVTQKKYVLKIHEPSRSPSSYELIRSTTSFLLDRGVTPHLMRFYETHPITEKDNVTISDNEAYEKKLKQVHVLELLEGDLTEIPLSFEQRLIFEIQNRHAIDTLKRLFDIDVFDNQLKNKFYTSLSKEHLFKGYRLDDFDFWKYRVDGVELYIPKSSHLFKLGDYDYWSFPTVRQKSSLTDDPCPDSLNTLAYKIFWTAFSSLRTRSTLHSDVLAYLEKWAQEPQEPSATILEMD